MQVKSFVLFFPFLFLLPYLMSTYLTKYLSPVHEQYSTVLVSCVCQSFWLAAYLTVLLLVLLLVLPPLFRFFHPTRQTDFFILFSFSFPRINIQTKTQPPQPRTNKARSPVILTCTGQPLPVFSCPILFLFGPWPSVCLLYTVVYCTQ